MNTADPTLKSFAALGDPSRWVVVKGVPVFDEHEEDIFVPETDYLGNPVKGPDGKVKKKKERWDCDAGELEEICRVNNARAESTGDLAPITIGHTEDDAAEEEQPPIIGFAGNWRVGTFGPSKKMAALTDWWIEKGKEHLLKKYPRRSVELWRKSKIVDPISLLGARTPERDLGLLLTYCRRDRLRYSMEAHMSPESEVPAGDAPETPQAPAASTSPEYTPEMHHEYMKHCYSHPHAKTHHMHMLSKYMKEEPAQVEAEGGAPAPEEHMPAPKDVYAAGPGMGVATTPGELRMPKGKEKFEQTGTPERYAREVAELRQTAANQQEVINKLLARDKDRTAREAQTARELNRERYAREVRDIVERYSINLTSEEILQEAEDMLSLPSDEARARHLKKVERYEKTPTTDMAPMSFHRLPHTVEGGVKPSPEGPVDKAEYDAVVKYASNHPKDIDWDAEDFVIEATRKYRASKNGTNGVAAR